MGACTSLPSLQLQPILDGRCGFGFSSFTFALTVSFLIDLRPCHGLCLKKSAFRFGFGALQLGPSPRILFSFGEVLGVTFLYVV